MDTLAGHTPGPVRVGDAAPDAQLLDAEGRPVWLSDFWRRRPLVLVFTRHYG